MPFDKSPPELVARFDELAELVPEATRKQMFGFPSLVFEGHMFMGLFEDLLVLRLDADGQAALFDRGGQVFSPMAGRPMTGYVVVPEALVADAEMGAWLARALECARACHPRSRNQKNPRRRRPKPPGGTG